MSDTPRTDAAIQIAYDYGESFTCVSPEICRQLERENEALRKDAERYRWLRQMDRCQPWSDLLMRPITRTEDIDAAIDAALNKEQS
jgi:hypothetical protein